MRIRATPSAIALGVFAAVALAALIAAPVAAYEFFLDHNTDGVIYTFNNYVVDLESADIDIVVLWEPMDAGTTQIQGFIHWGYGGGGLYCYDVYGSVLYEQYSYLPDSPPFVNILPFTCVCVGRCACDASMVIQAEVTGTPAPGYYLLARLTFTRYGYSRACTIRLWPNGTFVASPLPEGTLVMQGDDTITGVPPSLANRPWGQIKALYR